MNARPENVVIQEGFALVVSLGGRPFRGRFVFLPSSLRAGDTVWLRLERSARSPLEVRGRVTSVVTDPESRSVWRPQPGGRFSVAIEALLAAACRAPQALALLPSS